MVCAFAQAVFLCLQYTTIIDKYLLGTQNVPDIVLGTGETIERKKEKQIRCVLMELSLKN